jgi:hypothetical protein
MSVVAAIHQTSKPHEIAKRLNAQYRSSEKTADEMGHDLVLLKQTKPPGIEWGVYLKELGIEFGRDYADRLIRRVEGREKTPINPKPAPGPSPEPDIEIVDEFPDQKTLKPADRKTLYDEGCALLERMDRQTRVNFFKYQERKYLADFDGAVEGLRDKIEHLSNENSKLRQKLGLCGFEETDGGRADAGYGEGPEGDCVIRAIAIATEKPYAEVRGALQARAARYVKRYPASGRADDIKRSRKGGYNHGHIFGGYLKSIGWQYTRPRERVYLRADMLPRGRLVVLVYRHAVAVIDGVIHDIGNPSGAGKVEVEGYWSKAAQ